VGTTKRRIGVFIASVVFAVLCVVITGGCCTSEEAAFDAVAAHLDRGGSYYRISDNGPLYREAKTFFRSFQRSLLEDRTSEKAGDERLMIVTSVVELAVRMSGITACRWSGASSVPVPDALETTFRNRTFYLLPEENAGVFWSMPGKRNRPLAGEISGLPADTLFAGDFILDLAPLGDMLERSSLGREKLAVSCRMLFKTGIRELCEGISGEWGFVVFARRTSGKYHDFVLTLPDRKLRLFKRLSELAGNLPSAKVGDTEITLRLPGAKCTMVCTGADDRLVIFSCAEAKEHFCSSDGGLARQPDFLRLSRGMPEEGVAVFYSAGTRPETKTVTLPQKFGGISIDPADFDRPQLVVVRREKDGLSVTANSGFDIPTTDIVSVFVAPVLLLAAHWDELSPLLPRATVPPPQQKMEKPGSEARLEAEGISACEGNLRKIAAALTAYAKKYGSVPAESDIPGLRKLLADGGIAPADLVLAGMEETAAPGPELLDFSSCSYVYFGAWRKGGGAKLPLLVDRPENHSDLFHVIFNDGSVASFKLENCTSVRRMAGFLHTKFSYSEEDFTELIARASRLDALLGSR